MACGVQCNFNAAHPHMHSYNAAIFCWCINLFVWWHCLCSLTFKFLSPFTSKETALLHYAWILLIYVHCLQFCIPQQLHSVCLLEINDRSIVRPVNPTVLANNSIKLVPFLCPTQIDTIANEWDAKKCFNGCRRLDLNVWSYIISNPAEMKLLFLIKATPKTICELFWFALFCLGVKSDMKQTTTIFTCIRAPIEHSTTYKNEW